MGDRPFILSCGTSGKFTASSSTDLGAAGIDSCKMRHKVTYLLTYRGQVVVTNVTSAWINGNFYKIIMTNTAAIHAIALLLMIINVYIIN